MKNPELAERVRFFKETEEGQRELSDIDARVEARGEAKKQREIAANLVRAGQLSLEAINDATGLAMDELRKLKKKAELQPS